MFQIKSLLRFKFNDVKLKWAIIDAMYLIKINAIEGLAFIWNIHFNYEEEYNLIIFIKVKTLPNKSPHLKQNHVLQNSLLFSLRSQHYHIENKANTQ